MTPLPTSDSHRFAHTQYVIKRPVFSVLGRRYYVYAPDGSPVLFLKHPLLKLREEFTMFTDDTESTPLLIVRSRKIVAVNMAHDVIDAASQQTMGSVRSRGMKSLIRDTWDLLDPNDQVIGLMEEEGQAMLRRFLKFLPGRHKIELNGRLVATLKQKFTFFGKEVTLDFSPGGNALDRRLGIACGLLALIKESSREDK